MYYIWQHILTYDQGRLRVNLLLNRASDWADVYRKTARFKESRRSRPFRSRNF